MFPDYALAYSGMAAAGGFLSLFGWCPDVTCIPKLRQMPSAAMLSIPTREKRARSWAEFETGLSTVGMKRSSCTTARWNYNPATRPLTFPWRGFAVSAEHSDSRGSAPPLYRLGSSSASDCARLGDARFL